MPADNVEFYFVDFLVFFFCMLCLRGAPFEAVRAMADSPAGGLPGAGLAATVTVDAKEKSALAYRNSSEPGFRIQTRTCLVVPAAAPFTVPALQLATPRLVMAVAPASSGF